jgi:Flp pilus assembly protein protease CpaA
MIPSHDTLVVGGMLLAATLTDLRRREVPSWLTFGGITSGVVIAAMSGADALIVSLLGMLVGGSIVMPFVLIGAFGAADALLLATIGAWTGPVFVLWTAWWMSIAGGVLAIIAWCRGQATFPYVPAISVGAALAFAGS